MTQRGFPKYWWGQRGKPTADLIKHRSSVDTETDGASLAAVGDAGKAALGSGVDGAGGGGTGAGAPADAS